MSVEMFWDSLAEAYGFLGNSLLKPMSQTAAVGIDPEFWAAFPDFGDAGVKGAIARCERYAEGARSYAENGGDAVERVSVEYTRLFVGPPSPPRRPLGDDASCRRCKCGLRGTDVSDEAASARGGLGTA